MTAPRGTDSSTGARDFRRRWLVLAMLGGALAVAGMAALLVNIFSRQQEARNPFYRVVALDDTTDDPAVWGRNFPLQYDDYRRTVDQVRTRYGGSEGEPHSPSTADPRSVRSEERRVGKAWRSERWREHLRRHT